MGPIVLLNKRILISWLFVASGASRRSCLPVGFSLLPGAPDAARPLDTTGPTEEGVRLYLSHKGGIDGLWAGSGGCGQCQDSPGLASAARCVNRMAAPLYSASASFALSCSSPSPLPCTLSVYTAAAYQSRALAVLLSLLWVGCHPSLEFLLFRYALNCLPYAPQELEKNGRLLVPEDVDWT